ncbi:hypothetical protein ROTAS13_04003 [Roseomonas sp. TAS13]|nr:hypothetical protein ROTAS13_04003 [Roseomonas sp. TAS13]
MAAPQPLSTTVAWVFMETSITPLPAPSSISPSTSVANPPACGTSASTRANRRPEATVSRSLPQRAETCPVSGMARMAPMAMPSSARPSAASDRPRPSLIEGMLPAQAP